MKNNYKNLKKKASEIRIRALEDTVRANRDHLGGSYSCVELLVALYYGKLININPKNIKELNRDYFIIGKGHACLSLYPILFDLGFISEQRYKEYGKNGSSLGGQLDITIPGVEYNTGSLGHALGICAGIALAAKMDGRSSNAISLVGDAECDEGSIWEAIFFAGEHKLKNLICIIDRNRLSVTQKIESNIIFGSFEKKMKLFGWNCLVINGHSYKEIFSSFEKCKLSKKPSMILANTIKGKGVSFMENEIKWHHSVPGKDEIYIARKELGIIKK